MIIYIQNIFGICKFNLTERKRNLLNKAVHLCYNMFFINEEYTNNDSN